MSELKELINKINAHVDKEIIYLRSLQKLETNVSVLEANNANFINMLASGEKRMDKMENNLDEVRKSTSGISSDVLVIKNAILGNGKEGLIKTVARHERKHNMNNGAIKVVFGSGTLLGIAYTAMRILT